MSFSPKYPINFLPNNSGDSTAKMLRQLMYERDEVYNILNSIAQNKLGSIKQSCTVATTGNITLSGLQTVDGIALMAGCRVLVWKQTDAKTNGIYLSSTGAWTRTDDANASSDFSDGAVISIEQGTIYGHGLFNLVSFSSLVLGTSNVTFEFIYAGNVAVAAAQDAANDAFISANAAATSEANALSYKNAASTSEANALAYKNAASTSEANALASANLATNKANESLISANNASTSEQNSAISATNSANSATSSLNEANRAKALADSINPNNWYLKSETYNKAEVDNISSDNQNHASSEAQLWSIIFG